MVDDHRDDCHDDWWDGERDGERIAELCRLLAPLREPPRPWGEVIARARLFAAPRSRGSLVYAALAGALAAAVVVGWSWGRSVAVERPRPPESQRLAPAVPVAEAPATTTIAVPTPLPIVVPVPLPQDDAPPSEPERGEAPVRSSDPLGRTSGTKPRRTPRPTSPQASPREHASAPPSQPLAVDCILDPTVDACLGAGERLPDTLTTAQVKQGIAPTKASARRCFDQHGAAHGERVVIKLSIAGADGSVSSAVPQQPHEATSLGRCVAAALAKARFPRFRKASLGVLYPVAH